MQRVHYAAAAILSVGLLGAGFYSDEAKEFKPKNGRFTIMFPAAKKSGDRQQVVDLGVTVPPAGRRTTRRSTIQRPARMPIEAHYGTTKEDIKYSAGSAGIPAALIKEIPLDKRFDLFSEAFVKALEGKITDETQINQGSIPGKRYMIDKTDGGVARMDLYLQAGWIMYASVEGKNKDALTAKEATDFFDSFKLTQPEKKGDDKKADDKKTDDKKGTDKE